MATNDVPPIEAGPHGHSSGRRAVVAVFNSNDDVVEMLRTLFETAGFIVVSGHVSSIKRGSLDLLTFVQQHDPCVIVYDLVPPYDRNWAFLDHLRTDPLFEGRKFVMTSTNAKQAEAVAGRAEEVYEIVGKPFDLDMLVAAVREASRSRPVK
jgi:CheY-like chemotaxis protein